MSQNTPISNLLALDVGDRRIGVARANSLARLPQPLDTLQNDAQTLEQLKQIIADEQIDLIVVGLPRDLKGNETAQTQKARDFAKTIESLGVTIRFQDEALTSVEGEKRLSGKKLPQKGEIDAQAACIILEDYLMEHA